ncbi:hypothetical protein BASA81_003419 [Batrachochytrium salamandrivorans]|nr:hypothetical protein BASA81_003419 [Batrachochytrium salamandrivorans]
MSFVLRRIFGSNKMMVGGNETEPRAKSNSPSSSPLSSSTKRFDPALARERRSSAVSLLDIDRRRTSSKDMGFSDRAAENAFICFGLEDDDDFPAIHHPRRRR